MQDKYIQNRNLVVVNTFDEFTDKLNQIDSNVEDIVGYITFTFDFDIVIFIGFCNFFIEEFSL